VFNKALFDVQLLQAVALQHTACLHQGYECIVVVWHELERCEVPKGSEGLYSCWAPTAAPWFRLRCLMEAAVPPSQVKVPEPSAVLA
jgi:hypothetical protein